jgi:hypothetical protein
MRAAADGRSSGQARLDAARGAEPLHHRRSRQFDLALLEGHHGEPAPHHVQQFPRRSRKAGLDGLPKRSLPTMKVS